MRATAEATPILTALLTWGCTAAGPSSAPNTPTASVSIAVSPSSANIRAGDQLQFTATVSGSINHSVTRAINGTFGGSSTLGTISSTGNYSAPSSLPNPHAVTLIAASTASTSTSASSAITLMNPTPALNGINPASVGAGHFSIVLTGSKFISGAQVLLGSTPLTTTFVSSTQLAATGTDSLTGIAGITVVNPEPGSSSSK